MKTNRRTFIQWCAAAGAGAMTMPWLARGQYSLHPTPRSKSGDQAPDTANPTPPNILVLMVDDMGFSDIGCFGGEIDTPNLDRLAAEGIRFSNFYTNAKCEPTRSTLMTGYCPGYEKPEYKKSHIIGAMKDAGYWTARVGKVHDPFGNPDRAATMGPCASHWDLRNVKGDYDGPMGGFRLDRKAVPEAEFKKLHPDFYSTDAWTDYTIQYIKEGKDSGKPFFIYTAFNAPHYPLHAREEDIAKYRGKYLGGWAELRKRRYAKQKEIGLFGDHVPELSPVDEDAAEWDSLDEQARITMDEIMATYAAMIDRVDQGVGRVLKKLEDEGVLDNTVIFFLSDNGACAQGNSDGSKVDRNPRIGSPGTWNYVGRSWANASNTPFRKYKTWNHEGGISDPLIVWGKGVKPGNDHNMAWVGDLTATCLDLAGAPNPNLVGLSLQPGFQGGERPLHETMNWAILGGNAARKGEWKAVRHTPLKQKRKGEWAEWELYHITEDRTELHNAAAEHPETLKELTAQWEAWSAEHNWIGRPEKN